MIEIANDEYTVERTIQVKIISVDTLGYVKVEIDGDEVCLRAGDTLTCTYKLNATGDAAEALWKSNFTASAKS